MSNKRPNFDNNSTGFNNVHKKLKKDSDFKAPAIRNGPNFNYNPRGNVKAPLPTSKIVLTQSASIVDKEWYDDDIDDEVLLLASQNAEQEEKKRNQERQQRAEELNGSFSFFTSKAQATGSKFNKIGNSGAPPSSNIRSDIKNRAGNPGGANAFVDLTESSVAYDFDNYSNPPARQPLQNKPNSTANSSQKENVSSQQAILRQENKIRALENQLKNAESAKADLQEKLTAKDGEASNLRRDKKVLEEKIKALKLQSLKVADKEDPERKLLLQKIEKMKADRQFQMNDISFRRNEMTMIETTIPASKLPFFSNFPTHSTTGKPEVCLKVFEIETSLRKSLKGDVLGSLEASIKICSEETQLQLAKVMTMLFAFGKIEHSVIDSLFKDASSTVDHIFKYIEHLELMNEEEITFESNPALTACTYISRPFFRKKFTFFDPLLNRLDKDEGFYTTFMADKFFPEELCSKPRVIIACYASIARYSLQFSENLLLSYITKDQSQTFVTTLCNLLNSYVIDSKNVFNYHGFAIASASLLSSLGLHYCEYDKSKLQVVSQNLTKLFRLLLECRCDNPLMMEHLTQFLVHVTKDPENTEVARQLCVNYPSGKIETSKTYKYCQYHTEACSFQLFLMYLLTAFKFKSDLNQLEIELLLKTTLKLNQIVSNIQEMKPGTLRFLDRTETDVTSKICCCHSNLIYAVLTLSHLALSNREIAVDYKLHVENYQSQGRNIHREIPQLSKNQTMIKEIVKGCITSIADLFMRVDAFTDFPLENQVFSGSLEQICFWLKNWTSSNNGDKLSWQAFDLNHLADSFSIINIKTDYLGVSENPDELMTQSNSEDLTEECYNDLKAEALKNPFV